jgi:hypothetical protein
VLHRLEPAAGLVELDALSDVPKRDIQLRAHEAHGARIARQSEKLDQVTRWVVRVTSEQLGCRAVDLKQALLIFRKRLEGGQPYRGAVASSQ